jgi:hypothetical protein
VKSEAQYKIFLKKSLFSYAFKEKKKLLTNGYKNNRWQ